MAEKEKPMTEEEVAKKAEEARATNVKKTLESKLIQGSVGSNLVLSNQSLYGSLGVESARYTYDNLMSSPEVQKMRDETHKEKTEEYRRNGVFESPAYPSNGDISNKLMTQANEVMSIAKLSELEKALEDVGIKLDNKVPEKLKNYSKLELIKKAYEPESERVNLNKLNDEEKQAFELYQVLSESYQRACALKASQANYFADLNARFKKVSDLYKPKEEAKETA